MKVTLLEMSMSRVDAINKCYSIGKLFIEHFDKIYKRKSDIDINHWCSEMQAWYNEMLDITLKSNKRHLNGAQRRDWFYSFGSSYEEYFHENENEIEMYERFLDSLEESHDVYFAIKEVIMNNKIILFSTGCPKCNVLKQKLKASNIEYKEESDMTEIIDKGYMTVPILKVNDSYMEFKEANDWINDKTRE